MSSSARLLLALALTSSSALADVGEDDDDWVAGPAAPTSTAPLPPAVAPRDGEPGRPAPQEVLVVPDRPPEDRRVDVDAGLLAPAADLRLATSIGRRALTSSPFLDLDGVLAGAGVPGLVWLSSSAGAARPVARGYGPGQLAIVVDGVPLLTDAFGVSVAPSELLSPVGVAGLTLQHGPRAFAPVASSQAGVLLVDTGGALSALGTTTRADGLLAGGSGGADVESGATALMRTGWRTLRVLGHGTVLHREDQRPGRVTIGIPSLTTTVPASTALLPDSGGSGGMVGARVDVVPLDHSRLFVSYVAGRSLDVPDPGTCARRDETGRAADCIRAVERGVDVGIVGFDVRRDAGGLALQPTARVHLQRAISFDERSGRERSSVDIARDEVVRGGATIGLLARADAPVVFDLVPALHVAVDVFADRATSSFAERSLRRRDAVPIGDGAPNPLRARAVDGAVARQGLLRTALRLDGGFVSAALSTRLQALQVQAPAVVDADGTRAGVDVVAFAPSLDGVVRAVFSPSLSGFVAAGSVERGDDPAALVAGPGHGRVRSASPAGSTRGSERFAEVGLALQSAAIDVDAVAFGSLRAAAPAIVDTIAVAGPDAGVVGLEGRFRLKPAIEGVDVSGSLAGVIVDADVLGDRAPAAGVIQPQGRLQLGWAPSSSPFGVYGRVWGALPQVRLSPEEERDPQLCPERPQDGGVPADRPCSGAPGFANVDVGAFLQLGQLRFDVAGENLLDHRNVWRGAVLGVGGAAVRARVAFLF